MYRPEPVDIVIAEDDEDDYLLTREALQESRVTNTLYWVRDGEELLRFLRRKKDPENPAEVRRPGLILLDLNMPRMDGREALAEIKKDEDLRRIPVIVLTTSDAEADVVRSYDLGVNSFIQKPVSFEEFTRTVRNLTEYWFQLVRLPG
jgi:two-component system, response regulator